MFFFVSQNKSKSWVLFVVKITYLLSIFGQVLLRSIFHVNNCELFELDYKYLSKG